MNYAVIVAAGSGNRFGSDKSKIFTPLAGRPLIIHTLEAFENCPVIDGIVLVLSADGENEFYKVDASAISKLKAVVIGGETRAESVKNGIDALDAWDVDIIAVHDGARPLVTPDEISRTVEAAQASGAACLVADVIDTIKTVNNGQITDTIDRKTLRRALTPQAFRADILKQAFAEAALDEGITDECSLVERLGVPITAVNGTARNIKVTQQADIAIAEAYLR
jgi:2-C-methyl-D-erythritol 4-phosphate cytidylyltransferase